MTVDFDADIDGKERDDLQQLAARLKHRIAVGERLAAKWRARAERFRGNGDTIAADAWDTAADGSDAVLLADRRRHRRVVARLDELG